MSATPEGHSTPPPLDIRKYPNRRYYDTTHSRHLTLEEIRGLIREGHDIAVRDSKTGADLTAQVLTQIILELDTPKLETFPVPLLLQIIRVNDRWVRDFVETYLNQAFRSFVEYQKLLDERVRQMRGMAGAFPPFGQWASAFFAPPFSPAAPPAAAAPPPPPAGAASGVASEPEPGEMRRLIEDLRRQVAAMERQLGGGGGRRGARGDGGAGGGARG